MQRGQAVLVDTNIIIEAVRTNCWTALTAHFKPQFTKARLDLWRAEFVLSI